MIEYPFQAFPASQAKVVILKHKPMLLREKLPNRNRDFTKIFTL